MTRAHSIAVAGFAAILSIASPLLAQSPETQPSRAGARERSFAHIDAYPQAIAVSPDGRMIAVGYHSGQIRVWDAETLKVRRTIDAFPKLVQHVQFSPDGRYIAATANSVAAIRVWDVASGALARTYLTTAQAGPFTFDSRSGRLLAVHGEGILAWKFEVDQGRSEVPSSAAEWRVKCDSSTACTSSLMSIALSAEGRYLAGGSSSGEIFFWTNQGDAQYTHWRLSGLVRPFKDREWVTGLGFTSNSRYFLATNRNGELLQYDLSRGELETPLHQHPPRYANFGRMALANGGRTLVTSGTEIGDRLRPGGIGPGIVEVWDLPRWTQRVAVRELSDSVWATAHGDSLFIADGWWGLNVHDLNTGALRVSGPRELVPEIIRDPTLARPQVAAVPFGGESVRHATEAIPAASPGAPGARPRLESFDPRAISTNGLTVSACCARVVLAWATGSWSSGKVYFEVTLSRSQSSPELHPFTDVGVVTSNLRQTGMVAAKVRPEAGFAYGVRAGTATGPGVPKAGRLAEKDLVGFALDIDAGRLYVHVNGSWLTDAPGAGTRWIAVPPGWDYTVSLLIAGTKPDGSSITDAWTVNFGDSPLRFGPPAGFRASGPR